MPGGKRLTVNNIRAALKATFGNVTEASGRLGVERRSLWRAIVRLGIDKAELADLREAELDSCETALISQALAGNITALIFILKCRGKARGYIERGDTIMVDRAVALIARVASTCAQYVAPDNQQEAREALLRIIREEFGIIPKDEPAGSSRELNR